MIKGINHIYKYVKLLNYNKNKIDYKNLFLLQKMEQKNRS